MTSTVLDFSAGIIPAKAVRDAGHIGSVRYISPPRESWMRGKPATAAEVADYKANALDTAFVWQYGGADNPDAMRGARGGELDAKAADEQLKLIKRTGYPVFFAVDFDITLKQWNSVAVEYFRAACKVLGRDRVGIYGHSRVCDWAREDGVIGSAGAGKFLMWQTRSWVNDPDAKVKLPPDYVHPLAVLYQRTHNVPGPAGMQVDVNDILHVYWGQHPPRPDQSQDQTVTDPAPTAPSLPTGPAPKPTAQFKCDADVLTWRDNGIARRARRGICIHTDESAYNYATGQLRPTAWTADQLAEYNRRRDISGGSYHLGIDRAGRTVRQNDDVYGTWSVGSLGNDEMFHVCCTGTAYQTREQWLSLGKAQLAKLADVLAHYCRFHDIEPRRIAPADLRAGRKGILGHWDCSKFYGGSDHWDPGGYDGTTGVPRTAGGFPWDYVLGLLRKQLEAPAPTPALPHAPTTDTKETIMNDQDRDLLNRIHDQQAGMRDDDGVQRYRGWEQLGGRTLVDGLAAIGEKLGVDGFRAPLIGDAAAGDPK
ncbi:glycoside hydrolase domain-containing protein [Corynebacterium hansenii]|uniref:Glycoside hydrolase domain-containing protein n=1 Tax=Corynebacterium hansenii TaxID=394964 RepID=A0ABV7ZNJ1_9CORY|nr:glycoside hydrolase domain-containing protein [Corynebacterium hansenii]WJZ00313.1 N-acetylmuramoyl-L-alanine amidase [Corynebacterium hansenii]